MLEIRRKIVHATGVFTILPIIIFGKWNGALIMLLISLALFLLGLYRRNRKKFKIIKIKPLDEFEEFIENGFKEYERPDDLPFKGATEFFFGCFLSTIIFEPSVAIASIAILSLADAMSTLIGSHYGKHKLIINKYKSWEGSIAFFLTSIFVLIFFNIDPLKILVIGIIATFAEMLPRIDDNLVIPLVVGLALTIMG